ncbi:dipeptidase PepV [Niallia sp. XMNu-256]|uniref:dipeptidase PepV n=1 Tax=Niallia sp. XMNu-256 TaxID=3082444 RepID=UPI0030D3BD82
MTEVKWIDEVEKRQEELIHDTQKLLQIKSVLDDPSPEAPLGVGVKEALEFMLQMGEKDGFRTKNVGNLAGHIEFGEGDESIGILCHVDVVPEGDGWSSDPYGAEIRDGKIFARGAIDDKGPTMAAYYAMKIVKELGLPVGKRVRMIIGTDEESEWRCVKHYFEHEEMPIVGFAPDADFPIIFAEKGIVDFDLVQKDVKKNVNNDELKMELIRFESGRRYNMVPDFAKAAVHVKVDNTNFIQKYDDFRKKHALKGKCYVDNGELILELEGVSAHGMEPNNGKNAGLFLIKFLHENNEDPCAATFLNSAVEFFYGDTRGSNLGVSFQDDISGELTINVGKLAYDPLNGGTFGLNLRYPVKNDMEATKNQLAEVVTKQGFSIQNYSDSKPHHVDENSQLIQVLKKVYEEQTGEKAELLAIGGGTYARSLSSGVAFGPLFPGRENIAHQKDEYMYIDDLIKATAIYAQAIYELAK